MSPSAKLSVSYPNTEVYEPICYNRSLEKDPRVAWPFGYGLTYTTFAYSNLKTEVTEQGVNLTFEVKNTGQVAADEIVQIYVSPTSTDQPLRPIQLQGFTRVSLKPGESKTVKARLDDEQFGYYSHEGERRWNILPGDYVVKVGASSTDIRLQQTITLTGNPVSLALRERYFSKCQ